MKIEVGIVGVTGYSGAELLKLLIAHPQAEVCYLAARQLERPKPVEKRLPAFRGAVLPPLRPFDPEAARKHCELIFLALPNGLAMRIAPRLLRKPGLRVIDLSGDFRFPSAARYRSAYGTAHANPAWAKKAAYGLPELYRDQIPPARLVANPGCYPTAILLALWPLAEARLIADPGPVADAKSGVTGAGRALKPEMLFAEVNEDLRAYRVGRHQHTPEMEQHLKAAAGRAVPLTFIPHLVPMNRGLYASLYVPLKKRLTEAELRALYAKRYSKEPFVRLLPKGIWPQTQAVRGTNRCDLALHLESSGRRAVVLAAIDNLGKGAAGQAVQNMNLLSDFPETEGLR